MDLGTRTLWPYMETRISSRLQGVKLIRELSVRHDQDHKRNKVGRRSILSLCLCLQQPSFSSNEEEEVYAPSMYRFSQECPPFFEILRSVPCEDALKPVIQDPGKDLLELLEEDRGDAPLQQQALQRAYRHSLQQQHQEKQQLLSENKHQDASGLIKVPFSAEEQSFVEIGRSMKANWSLVITCSVDDASKDVELGVLYSLNFEHRVFPQVTPTRILVLPSELELSNRVWREFMQPGSGLDSFSMVRVTLGDENGSRLFGGSAPNMMEDVFERVEAVLKEGEWWDLHSSLFHPRCMLRTSREGGRGHASFA
eukprot:1162021-Pelagomonas_calceolata.AAC.5